MFSPNIVMLFHGYAKLLKHSLPYADAIELTLITSFLSLPQTCESNNAVFC